MVVGIGVVVTGVVGIEHVGPANPVFVQSHVGYPLVSSHLPPF